MTGPGLRVLMAPTATLYDVLAETELEWVDVSAWTAVEVHIDGRILHESLLRWRRTSGGAPLGLG
ncbi:MAG TPA: hypothetical protein PL146_08380 [Mycobacterium sp.]|nr:hypothetical protein [Mycobacterium sp.]